MERAHDDTPAPKTESSGREAAAKATPARPKIGGRTVADPSFFQRSYGNRLYARALRGDPPIQAKLAEHGPSAAPTSLPTAGAVGLPASIQSKMERAFGASFAGVTIRPNSPRAARLGALALTQGDAIDFAPGSYEPLSHAGQELIGHELTHVLQQRSGQHLAGPQGKSPAAARAAALGLHHDAGAERQADDLGRRAARGEEISAPSLTRAPAAANGGGAGPVQAKMGFELEMLILIDHDGRPVPEKTEVGHYKNHLSLDVDQSPSLDTITPELPETTNFEALAGHTGHYFIDTRAYDTVQDAADDPAFWVLVQPAVLKMVRGFMDHAKKSQQEGTDYDLTMEGEGFGDLGQVVLASIEALQLAEKNRLLLLHGNDEANEDFVRAYGVARRKLTSSFNLPAAGQVTTEFLVQIDNDAALKLVLAQSMLQTFFTDDVTHDEVPNRDATGEPGMGSTRYASILELVTGAYAPETDVGLLNILAAMKDATDFAQQIETANPRSNRVQLNTIAGTRDVADGYHIGNPRQKAQTTDASIQSTFALDLAQLASFIKSTMAPNSQAVFHTKHDNDYYEGDDYHFRAEEEILQSVTDATDILNDFLAPPDLPNLRGLLILMGQYLRLGRFSFSPGGGGRWNLDKNVTDLLSRTNLSAVRLGMPLAERNWLAGKEGDIRTKLLTKTARTEGSALLTSPDQTVDRPGWPTVREFIDNTLLTASDGITGTPVAEGLFGGFKRMNAEEIHPRSSKLAETSKVGPVFELRNMLPFLEGNERFPRAQWVPLARQLTTIIHTLHERTDAQAMRDVVVKTQAPGGQLPGSHSETVRQAAWKT